MQIYLASDHAGFELKEKLKAELKGLGYSVADEGAFSLVPDDDYPDFIFPAARVVASGGCERGIVLGRSGQGEAMAANRIKGVRCAVFYGPAVARRVIDARGKTSHNPYEIIRLSRAHNDSNMLSLAASFVSFEDMKATVKLWLDTPFSDEERHERRNKKLDEV